MKAKFIGFIRKRTVRQFAAFFGLAFVFLVFSKLSNDYRQQLEIQLNLTNLQDDVILSEDSPRMVTAVVEAKGFALVPYLFSKDVEFTFDANKDVQVTADAYILDVPKHRYLFEEKFGEYYTIRSLRPDSIFFGYSKLKTKKVPIQLNSDLSFTPGFDLLGNLKSDVDSVMIVGPELSISSIDIVHSESLVLNDINIDIETTLPLVLDSFPDVKVLPKEVKVSGKVRRFTEGSLEIPVFVTNKPEDVTITIYPKSITVVFYADLQRFKDISPSDFIVECQFPEDVNSASYLVPKLVRSPNGIKRVTIKQKRIDFIIL